MGKRWLVKMYFADRDRFRHVELRGTEWTIGRAQGSAIELPGKTFALALNLERDSVGAVVLGDYEDLREGDTAKTTGEILSVPTGPEMLGRVVNALGEAIDGNSIASFA